MANGNNQQAPGLLANMGGLRNLAGNPLFNVGMGLLQARADSSVNPFEAAMSGLLSATEWQDQELARQRKQKGREEESGFYENERQRLEAERLAREARNAAMSQQRLGQLGNMNAMSPAPGYYQPQMSPAGGMQPSQAMQMPEYNMMGGAASQPFYGSLPQPMNEFARRMAFDIRRNLGR